MGFKCPKCGSSFVYYRVRKKEWICRRCGHTWK